MKEIMDNTLQGIVNAINSRDEWNMMACEMLCEMADMLEEWYDADGGNFESVVYAAAQKLNVKIC